VPIKGHRKGKMNKNDRRNSPRQKKEALIQFVPLLHGSKSRRGGNHIIPGKMYNQSDEGLYIEIDCAHMPGSNVRIRIVSPEGYHPEKAYYIIDGRVIRCDKVNDEKSRFGLGIQILRKTIEAHIPESPFK